MNSFRVWSNSYLDAPLSANAGASSIPATKTELSADDCGTRTAAGHPAHDILARLAKAVRTVAGADQMLVWLPNQRDMSLMECELACPKLSDGSLEQVSFRDGRTVLGHLFAGNRIRIVPNHRLFPVLADVIGYDKASILALPLRGKREIVGAIGLLRQQGEFSAEMAQIVADIAYQAAVALENAQQVSHLESKVETLKAQTHELDAFAHTVAHDLKGPLAIAYGYADMLSAARDVGDEDSAENELISQAIVDSVARARSIIDTILEHSTIPEEKTAPSSIKMAQVVEQALTRCDMDDVAISMPDKWPRLTSQPHMIESIWANYISNAIKYGGNMPIIELGYKYLPDGRYIRFWVKDNGSGIPVDNPLDLFEPNIRADKAKADGHGLGLWIVKRIVTRLGGRVHAENHLDGAMFAFDLPLN